MAFLPRNALQAFGGIVVASLVLAGCAQGSDQHATDTSSASVSSPVILNDGKLKFCNNDNPPNSFYDEDSGDKMVGVEIDLATALSAELGLQPEFQEYAFSGIIAALQAQQCDVIMGSLYIKPEREEVVNFVPYLFSGTAVAVSTENPKMVTGYDDSLCGLRVIATTGSTGATRAEERTEECEAADKPALDVTLIDEGTNGLQQVIAGQVDAAIDTLETVGYYEQKSDGQFKMVGEPFGKLQIGAASLKENTELHSALTDAFQSLVDSGEYEDILATWGVEDNNITFPADE